MQPLQSTQRFSSSFSSLQHISELLQRQAILKVDSLAKFISTELSQNMFCSLHPDKFPTIGQQILV